MLSPISLVPLLALGTLAQTTVQSIFFAAPSESNAYAGSVVGVADGLTTYALACTSGTVSCATSTTITITEGPSTIAFASKTVVQGEAASVSETCKIDGTTSATCVAAVSLSANGVSTATTTTTTIGTEGFHYHPVTITAGANKLGSSGSASSSDNAGAPMVTGMGMAGVAVMGLAALL